MAEDLVLLSLFEESFPEEWRRDPEFSKYLTDLTSFTKTRLTREPALIKEEQECVLNSTQKLAFNNYSTFIQTAQCSRDVFQEFINVETHVDQLITKIPNFSTACKDFGKQAQEISTKRKLNSLALSKHAQLLEILEIPQLMETCVRNGYYEEALELSGHVRRMVKKHSTIPIVKNISDDTERFRQLMLNQLVQQLQGSLVLPVCLRLVGLLRRMAVFSETELRLKFLQARDHWLQSVLSSIPKDDPYLHISKTIDACRVHLFDIVTQYKALFPDDDSILAGIHGRSSGGRHQQLSDGALFCGWLNSKIWQFLCLLESDLHRGVGNRIDSLLSQCMYFGLSFSRVGADFRSLIMPVFVRVSLVTFQHSLRDAKHQFHEAMKHFTLTQCVPPYLSSTLPISAPPSSSLLLSPPHSLLSYQPFEVLTNALVTAFNNLRPCAPLALGPEVTREIDRLLQSVVHDIGEYHRIEHLNFTKAESQSFTDLCRVIVVDFLPFIENCLSVFFPKDKVNTIALCSTVTQLLSESDRGVAEQDAKIRVGISSKELAQPLRDLVPELFDEIEREELKKSMSSVQQLFEETSDEATSTSADADSVATDTVPLNTGIVPVDTGIVPVDTGIVPVGGVNDQEDSEANANPLDQSLDVKDKTGAGIDQPRPLDVGMDETTDNNAEQTKEGQIKRVGWETDDFGFDDSDIK